MWPAFSTRCSKRRGLLRETRPVKTQDAVAPGEKVNQPADREILDHRSVAMEQHRAWRIGIATVDAMESDTVAFGELADRRVPLLRQSRESKVGGRQDDQNNDDDRDHGLHRRHRLTSSR